MPSTSRDWMHEDASDVTTYQIGIPTEDWTAWKESIPRTIPLYKRIHALIQIDTALDGETDVAAMNLLRMQCERIAQRAATAQQALDDDDPHKARAELEDIADLAQSLAGE